MRIGLAFSLLATALLALTALAPQACAQASEKRIALVIGNSAYRHTAPLLNPANDASDIASRLEALGFEVMLGLNLGKAAMDRKIADFAEAMNGAETGLFFYGGHGLQVGGSNYLVPIDSQLLSASSLDFEMVKLDLVQVTMERNAKTSLIFLDACRDNPLARNLSRALSGTRGLEISRGLAAVKSGVGTLISFSTQPGNVALDGEGRNSPFAEALVAHLYDETSLTDMLISVRNDVMAATDERQIPWEHSSLRSKFYFNPAKPAPARLAALPVRAPDAVPLEQEAELALWSAIGSSKNAELLESFLRQFPNGRFAATARIMIDALRSQGAVTARLQALQDRPAPVVTASLETDIISDATTVQAPREVHLTQDLQSALKRAGCYDGAVDGKWDEATRSALEAFAAATRLSVPTGEPTRAALDVLGAQSHAVCVPAASSAHDKVSKSATAGPRKSSSGPRRGRIASTGGGRSKGRDCTPINGPYGYYENPWCK